MFFRCLILSALLLVTAAACYFAPPMKSGDDIGVVMELPATLPGFISVSTEPDEVELRELPQDTQFAKRTYYTPALEDRRVDVVNVSIVLSGAERKSIHRPEKCLVAQGWTLIGSKVIPIEIGNQTLMVTDLKIERNIETREKKSKSVKAHYYYWFVGHDVSSPSHVGRTFLSLVDSITKQINHRWAYVAVQVLVTEGFESHELGQRVRNDAESAELAKSIIQRVVPSFQLSFMEQTK